MLIRLCLLAAVLACPNCFAEDVVKLSDLTPAEYAAVERASELAVTGTISFLASDELAGRGTPSKELTIATAYVASRLRAAGAVGLGPDGSYFIESTIDTIQTPREGCRLTRGQDALRTALLEGLPPSEQSTEPLVVSGTITVARPRDALPDQIAGPVLIRLGDSEEDGPPLAFQLQMKARQFAKDGATVLLVEADAEKKLWALAAQRQDTPRINTARTGFALPIVVVEPDSIDANQELTLTIPHNSMSKATVRNVAGVIRGTAPQLSEQAIVFSAHLDHLGAGGPGPDPIYNGADDDASGVTAVLTLADMYGALKPATKRSTIFMTFWGEERGLLGSKEFVKNSAWPLEQIVANINIEMIGRPEKEAINKCWMTGWKESNLGSIVAQGSRRLGVETFEHPSYSARLYRASDNYSFVQKGVIAHSFSAGSLHADYHQPSDEWGKLNLPHMTQVIRGLYAGTLPIAQGAATPRKAD